MITQGYPLYRTVWRDSKTENGKGLRMNKKLSRITVQEDGYNIAAGLQTVATVATRMSPPHANVMKKAYTWIGKQAE